MLKFTKTIKRVTSKEAPLISGYTVVQFTEDENGKSLSELLKEVEETTNIKQTIENSKILNLDYIFNFEIKSAPSIEDSQELRVAFDDFDKISCQKRIEALNVEDPTYNAQVAITQNKRAILNLNVKGLFDASSYSLDFNFCNLDMSDMDRESVEKGLIFVAGMAQRQNPTTFIIPTDLANYLNDPKNKETVIYKTFDYKIKVGSVYSNKEGLENERVRAI